MARRGGNWGCSLSLNSGFFSHEIAMARRRRGGAQAAAAGLLLCVCAAVVVDESSRILEGPTTTLLWVQAAAAPEANTPELTVAQKYLAHARSDASGKALAVPMVMMLRELWASVVHGVGRKALDGVLYTVGGYLYYPEVKKVARVVMLEFEREVFGGEPRNDAVLRRLRARYEELLREWWMQSLEDPWESLPIGVWQTLLKLYTESLEPAMRGSPKLEAIEEILFDAKLRKIRSWTDPEHVAIMQGDSSRMEQRLKQLHELRKEAPRAPKLRGEVAPAVVSAAAAAAEAAAVLTPSAVPAVPSGAAAAASKAPFSPSEFASAHKAPSSPSEAVPPSKVPSLPPLLVPELSERKELDLEITPPPQQAEAM